MQFRLATLLVGALTLTFATSAVAHRAVTEEIRLLSERIFAAPEDVDLLLQRGDLYWRNGDVASALVDVERARQLAPDNADVWMQRGRVMLLLDDAAAADASLTRHLALAAAPTMTGHWLRAQARQQLRRHGDALTDFDAALAVGNNVEAFVGRARLQVQMGRVDAAAAGLRQGMARHAGAGVLRRALVEIEIQRGRTDAAVELIDAFIAKAAIGTDWYLLRARANLAAGRTEAAARDRQRALRDASALVDKRGSVASLVSRARVYLALGESAAAARDLHQAVARAPAHWEALALLRSIEAP